MIDNSNTKTKSTPQAEAGGDQLDGHSQVYNKAILSLDNLGIAASMICLVHCLAMPFIVALLPFLGLQFLESHESHMWLGAAIIGFALVAIVPSYLKHRKPLILAGMITGIALVVLGAFFCHTLNIEQHEMSFLIAGNLLLVGTHLFNKKMFGCCDDEH